jgi:hypothetical protein
MSYNEVSKLLEDETGVSLLSDQRIHAIIHDEAVKVSECNSKEAKAVLASGKALPSINKEAAIYDSSVNEVLLFNDGIQVKKQKENREKRSESACNKASDSSESNADKRESRIQTDVIMLEKADGNYIHLMEGIEKKSDASASLEELLTSTIITEYGSKKDGLNLVAITDGASSIRLYFERVFGFAIMLILDWYHLEKKICGRRFDDLSETIFSGHHQPLKVWILCLYFMGLNLSNEQIARELDLNSSDVHQMTSQLREGIVKKKPPITLQG